MGAPTKPPPTLDHRITARLVPAYTGLLDAASAGRTHQVTALKREALKLLEEALFELARKVRSHYTNRELADHIASARSQTLQSVADRVAAERPEYKHSLHLITNSRRPRA